MRTAAFIAALAVVPLTQAEVIQRGRYLMGTVCEVAAARPEQIERAFAEAKRIEGMLSTWTGDSELARVNRGEIEPSDELNTLLSQALQWSKRTDRAFDPRIKPLIDLWKTREEGTLPAPAAIARAREAAGATRQFEEGGFGKGYALDRMLALIDGDALINFGGQVIVRGTHEVTVADPADRRKPAIAFTIENASLSTSSGSENTFEVDGRRFSHILDPRTGEALPPRGSVSVISKDALTADVLSTALYVMGEDDGVRWADAHGVAAIFINPSNHVRLSATARERARGLELLDRNFSMKD